MTFVKFFTQLFSVTLVVCILLGLLFYSFPQLFTPVAQQLGWVSCAFFVLLTVGMYAMGQYALESPAKNLFDQVLIGFNFIKIIASGILIFAFIYTVKPTGKGYILPFLLVYVVFTAYEVYLLSQMGHRKKDTKSSLPF